MQVHFGPDLLVPEWPRSVACIGTFDGVHLGHREVIGTAARLGRERGLPVVLVTFDRHPASVLAPDRCPPAVASLRSNLQRFSELGVDLTLVLAFDRALADTSAEDFLAHVIRHRAQAEALVVGHDFAFGHDRQGTPDWLAPRIETIRVPALEIEGVRVSSSAVRRAVSEGRVEDAAISLGRSFDLDGVVVRGDQIGRTLGFPTANIARSALQVTPGDGVYVGSALLRKGRYRAAISVGVRPTFEGAPRTIEAHLLDYDSESLYGQSMTLSFEARLRDQLKFESLEALKEQLARDVQATRGER